MRWADLAGGEVAATGESTRRREPSGVQTLTPQELRVSLLLGEQLAGRTARDHRTATR